MPILPSPSLEDRGVCYHLRYQDVTAQETPGMAPRGLLTVFILPAALRVFLHGDLPVYPFITDLCVGT